MTAHTPPARGAETVILLPPPSGAVILCRTCDAVADHSPPLGWTVFTPPLPHHPDFALGVCPGCRLLWAKGVSLPAAVG